MPIATERNSHLLPINTKVRVKLEAPRNNVSGKKLHGKLRAGDVKYELKPSNVEKYSFFPNNPPMYLVSGHRHAAYTRDELLPVKKNEKLDTSVVPASNQIFIMKKILEEKKIKNKLFYLISWKYYPKESDASWEPASTVRDVAPLLVEEWKKIKN